MMEFKNLVLLAVLLPFSAFARDFNLSYNDGAARYTVHFDRSGIQLSSAAMSFQIAARACSQKQIDEFQNKLKTALEKHQFRKTKEKHLIDLNVQGVNSRVSEKDRLARVLRYVPFQLFTLRQVTDRLCAKGRRIASDSVVESLSETPKRQPGPPKEDCAQCVGQAGADHTDEVKECLAALCPDKEFSNQKLTDEALHLDAFDDPAFKKDIAPLVEQILNLEKKKRERIEDLKRKISAGSEISDPLQLAGAKYFRTLLSVPYGAIDGDSDGHMILNVASLKRLRPDWDGDKIAAARQVMDISSSIDRSNNSLEGPVSRYLQVFGPDRIKIMFQSELKTLQARFTLLSQERRDLLGVRGLEIRRNIQKYSEINADDLPENVFDSLHGDFQTVLTAEAIVVPETSDAPVSLAEIYRDLRSKVKRFSEDAGDETDLGTKDMRSACASYYSILKTYSPSPELIERIKKQEQPLFDHFLTGTKSMLSVPSSRKVNELSKKWHFIFPQDSQSALVGFKTTLESEKRSFESELNSKVDSVGALDAVYLAFDQQYSESALASICKEAGSLLLDGAFRDVNAIYISPLVAKMWPRMGDVVNHETAHLLDFALSENGISEETKNRKRSIDGCLQSQHGQALVPTSIVEYKYAKEDFADFVGGLVDDQSSSGFSCLFLRDVLDTGKYEKQYFSLENADGTDTHSGVLFRALAHYRARGKVLPPSCISAMKKKSETPLFKDCRSSF